MPVAYKIRRILATTRIVTIRTLAGMAMSAVFVVFAFIALRLAIHGREVTVPNLANLSDADAATALKKLGLNWPSRTASTPPPSRSTTSSRSPPHPEPTSAAAGASASPNRLAASRSQCPTSPDRISSPLLHASPPTA